MTHEIEMTLELNKLKNEMQRYGNLMLEASVQLESIKKENAALKESLTKMVATFEEAIEKDMVEHELWNNDKWLNLSRDNYQDYKEACKILGIKPKELAG